MYINPLFRDRQDAGRILAKEVSTQFRDPDVIVLAIPRGGVPIGFEVAQYLHADLDIFLVRKLGVPGQEELAMGAIASGGVRVLNHDIINHLQLAPVMIDQVTEGEQLEIERRERIYRDGRPALPIRGRTAVLVDDGLATGATMLAAARAVGALNPKRTVVAVPVASHQACAEFQDHVDEVICTATPEPFYAVGVWYEDFSQTSDAEVRNLLERAAPQSVT